jgi:hypothetical protein
MRPISDFIWSIPSSPLEIKDLTDLELVRPRPNGPGGRAFVLNERGDALTRPYRPLDKAPALFRNFAELEVDETAIRDFAAKWGLLGGPARRQLAGVDDLDDPRITPSYWIEFLEDWEWQILWIRHALQLWDAYNSRDAATLARFISVDTEWPYPEDPRPLLAAYHADLRPEARWTTVRQPYKHIMINTLRNHAMSLEADLFEAALYAICMTVNAHLTSAAIVCTGLRTEQPRIELRLSPYGLIGVIWLQLALALEGSKEFRKCTVCRAWYGCSTGQARARRTYCSDKCKMRAYRHRKQKKAVS